MDVEMTNNTTGQSVSQMASAQGYSRYNSVVPKDDKPQIHRKSVKQERN